MYEIMVNVRTLSSRLTGTQRYAGEIVSRLDGRLEKIMPDKPLRGISGHVWEQINVPRQVGKKLLWSPSNTGPLLIQRQVLSLHDLAVIDHPEWFTTSFATVYQFLLPSLARRVRKIITMSQFSKNRIVERFGICEENIVVIHEAADRRFYPCQHEVVKETWERMNVPGGPYLLAVGSLEPRKNLARLLKAWEIAHTRIPQEVCLVIAGAKNSSSVFKNISLGNLPPRVHMAGYVPDQHLPALYSGAIALIYPSLYEGFGLPPLEAMACGTPVIVSNNTSLPEVVGEAGILINPYSEEEIASAIQRIVSDSSLHQVLSQKGLERAGQYSWDRAASLTWDVLQKTAMES
jgi:glycosyltransferase involved in cell wall biosynthesis